jgi:hypothetical protein
MVALRREALADQDHAGKGQCESRPQRAEEAEGDEDGVGDPEQDDLLSEPVEETVDGLQDRACMRPGPGGLRIRSREWSREWEQGIRLRHDSDHTRGAARIPQKQKEGWRCFRHPSYPAPAGVYRGKSRAR